MPALRLVVAVLSAALPAPALAADVLLPPTQAGTPAASVAAPVPPGSAPFTLHLRAAYDFGFEKAFEVGFTDGTTDSLNLNAGISLTVGGTFLPLLEGRLSTLAAIGFEYQGINASNGSVRWLAFPVEVMELLTLDPVRLGAGASLLLAPSLKGEGFADDADLDLRNSLGLVFQAEWIFPVKGSRRGSHWSAGLRYTLQRLQSEAGGPAVPANALGLVASFGL